MADIDKLFEHISEEVLSEDVKLQMAVLFENSLTEAIKAKEAELDEANKAEITTFKESLVNQIDDYLNYFTEDFVAKNAAPIAESVKLKMAEKVLATFSGIVNDFHVQLDEKTIGDDVKLTEARTEVSELTKQLIASKKEIKLREKAALVLEASFGLTTDLQKVKLAEYAKAQPLDEMFTKKLGAFCKTVLVEAKVAPAPKEKLVIVEDKPEFVAEEKKPTTFDSYSKYL
jgi:hypothetical protein